MSYERDFRKSLGFTNQETLKKYYKATDAVVVNWDKIQFCNSRLSEICKKLNSVVHPCIRHEHISVLEEKISLAYNIMRDNNIFPRLNNQGRTPDDVYYNWMRGYLVCEFFLPAIANLFNISLSDIQHIGEDDLSDISTFSRSATADLEIISRGIRLEMQAGFTGTNDIKRSKIEEARNRHQSGVITYIMHFDLFNGKVAIINISNVDASEIEYHKAFENTDVLGIKSEWFRWKLACELPDIDDVIIEL